VLAGLLGLGISGCAYYNAMWSAERLARDARRMDARGMISEARLNWARAATKAESVVVRHPTSRWADDALVLQGEGLALSGACGAAARPLGRALREVTEVALRERAALAAGECALSRGSVDEAEQLLAPVLVSRDARRTSRAAYLAGRAALLRDDPTSAADRFAHSQLPEAASARVRALAAAGRGPEAVAVTDSVARRDADDARWGDALDSVGRTAGVETAADVLDRLLARGRIRAGGRGRLLLADGDRLRHARRFERAASRYAAVVALVPDSVEAGLARVRALGGAVSQARGPGDLDELAVRAGALGKSLHGMALNELNELTRRIDDARRDDSAEVVGFRKAELARDSLDAPALAAALFLRFALRHPTSLFAPKALIAAGQLRPETLDSVGTVLQARYVESPYTLAFHGDQSPAFQVAEDSLAVALGLARPRVFASGAANQVVVAPPRTGPRGPELDPPSFASGSLGRGRAPAPKRPAARRPGERPTERPDDRPDVRP
jgi:hypothetical protein